MKYNGSAPKLTSLPPLKQVNEHIDSMNKPTSLLIHISDGKLHDVHALDMRWISG